MRHVTGGVKVVLDSHGRVAEKLELPGKKLYLRAKHTGAQLCDDPGLRRNFSIMSARVDVRRNDARVKRKRYAGTSVNAKSCARHAKKLLSDQNGREELNWIMQSKNTMLSYEIIQELCITCIST